MNIAVAKHTMDELDWIKAFTANYKTLVDDLNIDDAMPECLSAGLLSMKEKAEVDSKSTNYQKNDKFLTILYHKFCCNPSLFASFTKALSGCQNSKHLVQNINRDESDCIHKFAINKMKSIYRKTFHYVECKVNHLNIENLIPALVSTGVLDMDAKETIKNESEDKARKMLLNYIYKGFESYSMFTMILLKFGNGAEFYLGQTLCDVELWSPNPDQECITSCPCKEESFHHKPLVNHRSLLNDDVSSDSGLENETPIVRRKVIHRSSINRTDNRTYSPLTKTQKAESGIYKDYTKHVRSCYSNSQYFETNEWPSMVTNKYINLALIKNEKVCRGRADEFTKATLHGSIDQITKKKEPIKFNYLFSDINDRCILVQGGPGIGKSTFALQLCKMWKDAELLKQFKLVQLVQLGNSSLANATDIKSLLFADCIASSYIESVASEIVANSGEGILLVLDGFDELPLEKQSDSLYTKLVKGEYLPKCKIVITSRPSIAEKLERHYGSYISKSIEILGFLYKDIVSYVEDVFADDPKEITKFLLYINSNGMIRSMMYIPLNTAVVCELYKSANDNNKTVPMTMTKLYSDLTLSIIIRFMDKNHITYKIENNENIFEAINSFPSHIQKNFIDLCLFAFEKLCSGADNFIFSNTPDRIKHMGFIRKASTIRTPPLKTVKHTYIFLHLTLQEFLSAVYIAMQSEKDQLHALNQLTHIQEDIFTVVLRFVAGLTNGFNTLALNDISNFLGISHGSPGMNSCNSLALNCLYEAQNPELCMKVLCIHGGYINFSPMTITPFDYYALGYCIAKTNSSWKLCCIGAEGIELIALALQANCTSKVSGKISLIKLSYEGNKIYLLEKLPAPMLHEITELNLSNCGLDERACDDLANMISSLHNLQRLDISDNPFEEGQASNLLRALNQLKCLNYLDLLHARLNFQDLTMLKGIIKPMSTLTCLIIGDSSMSTDVVEEMVNVVLANSALATLSIMNINLALLATHLSHKLKDNTTLSSLMMWDRSFCIEGVEKVLVSLESNKTLETITLMPWYKEHIAITSFPLATQERIKWFFYPEKKAAN